MSDIEIKKVVQFHITEIKENVGNYLLLGGKGIMDGLAFDPCKFACYKILDADNTKITVKGYGSHHASILPSCNYDQEFKIISKKEFAKLPVY